MSGFNLPTGKVWIIDKLLGGSQVLSDGLFTILKVTKALGWFWPSVIAGVVWLLVRTLDLSFQAILFVLNSLDEIHGYLQTDTAAQVGASAVSWSQSWLLPILEVANTVFPLNEAVELWLAWASILLGLVAYRAIRNVITIIPGVGGY